MTPVQPPDLKVLLVEDDPAAVCWISEMLVAALGKIELSSTDALSGVADHIRRQRPHVLLLDLSLRDASVADTLKQIPVLSRLVPIVVISGSDDQRLPLKCVMEGAQDYIAKDDVRGDHLRWVVHAAHIRWHLERSLAHHRDERQALGRRADLARDLHDDMIQQLFICRLRLDAVTPEAIDIEQELGLIISELRATIAVLHGTGATLLTELEQLCTHWEAGEQSVNLTTRGHLDLVSDHLRLHLMDACITVMSLCAPSPTTRLQLSVEGNDHHVELRARILTERPGPTPMSSRDLRRLSDAASRLGGVMGWTWAEGVIRVRWSVPTSHSVAGAASRSRETTDVNQ